jgi:hypothetical protein
MGDLDFEVVSLPLKIQIKFPKNQVLEGKIS